MLVNYVPNNFLDNRVCLIEFGNGHVECIYAQLAFLKSAGYDVSIIARKRFEKRFKGFAISDQFYWLEDDISPWQTTRQILKYADDCRCNKFVINTFSGKILKSLLILSYRRKIVAVVHDLAKYRRSIWRRYISPNVRGLFVLNDYLLEYVPKGINRFDAFYPIFFPAYQLPKINKEPKDFWVCIPGQVELKRRDYTFLLQRLGDGLHPSIKFILLGQSQHQHGDYGLLQQLAVRMGVNLDERFILFNDFIDDSLFHAYVAKSDLILPLIFGNQRYFSRAVSGSLNLSFGYKIPLLVHENTQSIRDLNDFALTFGDHQFVSGLNTLYENRSELDKYTTRMLTASKFSFAAQSRRYLDHVQTAWRN